MLKKLDWVHPRMEELGMLLSDPAVVQDQIQKFMRHRMSP